MKKIILSCLVMVLFPMGNAHAFCTTDVSGVINGDSWDISGSPYCVIDNILVNNLSIGSGVRVEFMGDFEFRVFGTLNVTGSAASPVLFRRSNDSVAAGWQGIVLDNMPPGSALHHVRVEDSTNSGMRILNTIASIEGLAVSNNSASNGGGLYVELTSTTNELVLQDCLVSSNHAFGHGGGMWANITTGSLKLQNCKFNGNETRTTGNVNFWGGGIYLESADGGVTFNDSEISGNISLAFCSSAFGCDSVSRGGGMYVKTGTIRIENSRIENNRASASANRAATGAGGGIYLLAGSLNLVNSIVASNVIAAHTNRESGGGIRVEEGTLAIINSNVAYNVPDGLYNSAGVVAAVNCIIYHNEDPQIAGGGTTALNYCDIQGGWLDGDSNPLGIGNIDVDPLFVSVADFHLTSQSQAINAGNNNATGLPAQDFDGGPRIVDTIDMGPYEQGGVAGLCPIGTSQWDIDCSGSADALTDGILLLRYLFGFSGATLIDSVVDTVNCNRCTAEQIFAYLNAQ